MILEIKFLTGRFHATPWGHHPNEAMPEWPPSPFRLHRALLDSWYRKCSEVPRETVETLLAALAQPPIFYLPPARAGHTRAFLAQRSADPTDKKLVFDGFVVVGKGDSVLVGWPEVELSEAEKAAMRRLASAVNYLGRSESWVELSFADDRSVNWNCMPVERSEDEVGEVVTVASVVAREDYQPPTVERKHRKGGKKERGPAWLDALTWGSAETQKYGMNRPPGMRPMRYVRPRDALEARPLVARRRSSRKVEGVLYAVEGVVRAPITEAVRIAEQSRVRAMGIHKALVGEDQPSWKLCGHDRSGVPAEGHNHLSYMVLDRDRDGYVDHLLLVGGVPLDEAERQALDHLSEVRRKGGHSLVLTPILDGERDVLLCETRVVASVTPFVPNRHYRAGRDGPFQEWLERELLRELGYRGLAAPASVEALARPIQNERKDRWLDFDRARKGQSSAVGYGFRMEFTEAVTAPFSLGRHAHFGLGCFDVVGN